MGQCLGVSWGDMRSPHKLGGNFCSREELLPGRLRCAGDRGYTSAGTLHSGLKMGLPDRVVLRGTVVTAFTPHAEDPNSPNMPTVGLHFGHCPQGHSANCHRPPCERKRAQTQAPWLQSSSEKQDVLLPLHQPARLTYFCRNALEGRDVLSEQAMRPGAILDFSLVLNRASVRAAVPEQEAGRGCPGRAVTKCPF